MSIVFHFTFALEIKLNRLNPMNSRKRMKTNVIDAYMFFF